MAVSHVPWERDGGGHASAMLARPLAHSPSSSSSRSSSCPSPPPPSSSSPWSSSSPSSGSPPCPPPRSTRGLGFRCTYAFKRNYRCACMCESALLDWDHRAHTETASYDPRGVLRAHDTHFHRIGRSVSFRPQYANIAVQAHGWPVQDKNHMYKYSACTVCARAQTCMAATLVLLLVPRTLLFAPVHVLFNVAHCA